MDFLMVISYSSLGMKMPIFVLMICCVAVQFVMMREVARVMLPVGASAVVASMWSIVFTWVFRDWTRRRCTTARA